MLLFKTFGILPVQSESKESGHVLTEYDALFILNCLPGDKDIRKNQLFHILTGKRTASNLYHAKEQGLLPIFGLKEKLSKKEYDSLFLFWLQQGLVIYDQDESYHVTLKGKQLSQKAALNFPYPKNITTGRFGQAVPLFWMRLQLLVQVISHRAYASERYTPIVKDRSVQIWVKRWLSSQSREKEMNLSLGEEMLTVLNQMDTEKATLVSMSLSGFEQIGATARQRATLLDAYRAEMHLSELPFLDALYSFYFLCCDASKNTILYQLANEADNDTFLGVTKSTFITHSYLKQGNTPHQISLLRQLKEGTIWEHLIEWTILHPSSELTSYIPESIYSFVSEKLAHSPETTYLTLKEACPTLKFSWFRLIQLERTSAYEKKATS